MGTMKSKRCYMDGLPPPGAFVIDLSQLDSSAAGRDQTRGSTHNNDEGRRWRRVKETQEVEEGEGDARTEMTSLQLGGGRNETDARQMSRLKRSEESARSVRMS
ncbi:hypothetical protein EYF80_034318 [Liparis tanakae]|uniref:Uncharacterized protein n=1 Tax=Liparis tanakae TaxID=230148 RepID=A0A4Z2GPN8_9TELE|nr:hypothetical protein EYF80_034318 [Liparis tanakae]